MVVLNFQRAYLYMKCVCGFTIEEEYEYVMKKMIDERERGGGGVISGEGWDFLFSFLKY